MAKFLEGKGYKILTRNWRTKFCEIDIIAKTKETRYFIEVKYRASEQWGGGLAAVTPKKLRQMKFAAELYGARYPMTKNQQLLVATVDARNQISLLKVE